MAKPKFPFGHIYEFYYCSTSSFIWKHICSKNNRFVYTSWMLKYQYMLGVFCCFFIWYGNRIARIYGVNEDKKDVSFSLHLLCQQSTDLQKICFSWQILIRIRKCAGCEKNLLAHVVFRFGIRWLVCVHAHQLFIHQLFIYVLHILVSERWNSGFTFHQNISLLVTGFSFKVLSERSEKRESNLRPRHLEAFW